MKFANPGWLWFLLLVPASGVLLEWSALRARRRLERFARSGTLGRLMPELDPVRLRIRRVLFLLSFAFVLVAMARPQWGVIEETQKLTGLDIVVVLDVSNSMSVEDVVPNRLQKAKHFLRGILDRLGGDRVGIVAFAGSSYLASPLTTDLDYVREVLADLGPRSVANQGSDIGTALETATSALRRASETAMDDSDAASAEASTDAPPPSRVVLLLSDGEDHDGRVKEGARQLSASGTQLLVIGVGTESGGPVPVRDEQGQLFGYKRGENGQPVVSRFDPKSLREAAETSGGRYWQLSEDEREVDQVMPVLAAVTRGEQGSERRVTKLEERFAIPLWLAFACLVLEMLVPSRRRKVLPGDGRSIGARGTIALVICALSGPAASADGRAGSLEAFLENRKGLEASQKGKWEEALRRFGRAQAENPDLAELEYNQGTAHLGREEFDRSMDVLDAAARKAREQGDSRLAGRSIFNSAIAAEKAKKLDEAAKRYIDAMDDARRAGDAELEGDIRRNLELLARKNQQQKQQQQQQKQDEEKKKDEQQGEGRPQSGEDPGNDDEESKKKEPQRFQETSEEQRRRSFKSSKLSESDAEQVMSELSDKERELRARLGRRKSQGKDPSRKDW